MSNTVINTNVSALNSHRAILNVGGRQGRAAERLSTGMRINRAADDAAGLAISEGMRNQIRGLDQAVRNSQDGISLVQTAEGALEEVHRMAERIRVLTVQAANDTNQEEERDLVMLEIDQLVQDINRVISDTEFNGIQLLGGDQGAGAGNAMTVARDAFALAQTAFADAQATFETEVADANSTFNLGMAPLDAVFAAAEASANATRLNSVADANSNLDSSMYAYNSALNSATTAANSTFTSSQTQALEVFASATAGISEGETGWATAVATRDAALSNAESARGTAVNNANVAFNTSATAASSTFEAASSTATSTFEDAVDAAAGARNTSAIPLQTDLTVAIGQANADLAVAESAFTVARDAFTSQLAGLASSTASVFGIQSGANAEQRIDIYLNNLEANAALLEAALWDASETGNDISIVLDDVDVFINSISEQRANLGAYQNRLEHTINSLQVASENLSAANSRIRDTDMAAEMMQFTQANVLQQAGMSMLAQANMAPNNVLQLLG